jgi:hypothetical protein
MRNVLLIMVLFIGMVGFTPVELPTPESTEFIWESNKIEFRYIGDEIISKELLDSVVTSTIELGSKECDSFVPTSLTVNGESGNLVTALEFDTSKECSMTESLQLLIVFDDNGDVKSKFTTFN